VCNEKILPDSYSDNMKELNLQYISNAEKMLNGNYPRKELNHIIGFYIDKLIEKGLASKNGSLYIQEFQKEFLLYYPEAYLKMMQSTIDSENPTNWLRLFVRNNHKNRSPLRHLLLLKFLENEVEDIFNGDNIVGKRKSPTSYHPSFSIEEGRAKWLQLISENPGANRSTLKEKGKGLQSWIYKNDREWYDSVTPRNSSKKQRKGNIDWEKRDEECLELAKKGVEEISNRKGKPTRVTPLNIRRTIGVGTWLFNKKLVRTNQYIQEVSENINDFRIRKIKWAINLMIGDGDILTPYKIQRYAGFSDDKEVRKLTNKILEEYK
jgi:hypothetical protein